MNELVCKYNNQMNQVSFRNFTATEFDLLMTICSKMREQGLEVIEFTFDQLQTLSKYDITKSTKRFVKDLTNTYDKLIQLNFKIGDDLNFVKFVLFTKYKVSAKENTVQIAVNPEFSFVLNNLTSNFTRFELNEFLALKSKYTKDIYRLCKQFRSTGFWRVKIEEFRRLLDVPESYTIGMVQKQILTPCINELRKICTYFEVKKEYEKVNRQGRKSVVALQFRFEFLQKDEIYSNVNYKEKNKELIDSNRYLNKNQYLKKKIIINKKFNIDDGIDQDLGEV